MTSALAHGVAVRDGGRGQGVEVGGGVERGLVLEAVDGRGRMEDELGHLRIPAGAAGLAGGACGAPACGARVRTLTRKNLAVTGAKAMVPAPAGSFSDGTEVPAVVARLQAPDRRTGRCGRLSRIHQRQTADGLGASNSNWIQAFSPAGAAGRSAALARSPSVRAARSKAPPLEVTFAPSSASVRSFSGTRKATTALSA